MSYPGFGSFGRCCPQPYNPCCLTSTPAYGAGTSSNVSAYGAGTSSTLTTTALLAPLSTASGTAVLPIPITATLGSILNVSPNVSSGGIAGLQINGTGFFEVSVAAYQYFITALLNAAITAGLTAANIAGATMVVTVNPPTGSTVLPYTVNLPLSSGASFFITGVTAGSVLTLALTLPGLTPTIGAAIVTALTVTTTTLVNLPTNAFILSVDSA